MRASMGCACADRASPFGTARNALAVKCPTTSTSPPKNVCLAWQDTISTERSACLPIVRPPTPSTSKEKNACALGTVPWRKTGPATPARRARSSTRAQGNASPAPPIPSPPPTRLPASASPLTKCSRGSWESAGALTRRQCWTQKLGSA